MYYVYTFFWSQKCIHSLRDVMYYVYTFFGTLCVCVCVCVCVYIYIYIYIQDALHQ